MICEHVGMPKKREPDAATAARDLFVEIEQAGSADFMRQMLAKMSQETRVGGKRVTRQEIRPVPAKAATSVHRVKVTLHGSKPPVWRRLEIPSTLTLDEVHEVMQVAFGWYDLHLHQFETVCGEFTDPERDEWGASDAGDEAQVAIAQVAAEEKAKVVYVYDFGDDWRHDIVVEKVAPAEPGVAYPRCTAGRGKAPHEDSGGIWTHNENAGPAEPIDPADVTAALASMAEVIVRGS